MGWEGREEENKRSALQWAVSQQGFVLTEQMLLDETAQQLNNPRKSVAYHSTGYIDHVTERFVQSMHSSSECSV